MPRKDTTRITPAPQVDIASQPQATQIVSRPVNTFVQPEQDTLLRGLVEGLSHLQPGLQQYLNTRDEYKIKSEREQGKLAAEQGGYKSFDEGYAALSSSSSPWYQESYMQEVGRRSAQQYQRDLAAHLQENLDPNNPDPAQAEKIVSEFYQKQTKGLTDRSFLEGFNEMSQQANATVLGQVTQTHLAKLREDSMDMMRNASSEFLADPKRPADWLNNVKERGRMLNLPVKEVEREAFGQAAQMAITNADPKLLDQFAEETPDGQPSFAVREPEAYWRARRAAEAEAKRRVEGVNVLEQLKLYSSIEKQLDDAEQGLAPIEEDTFERPLVDGVKNGLLTPEKAATYYSRALDARRKYATAYRNSEAFIDGEGHTLGLSKEAKEKGLLIAGQRINKQIQEDKSIPEDRKDSLALASIVDMSLKNREVYPDHLKMFQAAAVLAPKKDEKGIESMPDRFSEAATVAYAYWKKDPVVFRNSFGDDKQSAMLYDRYFHNLERQPDDPDAAWRAARIEMGNSGNSEKTELPAELLKDTVGSALKKARDAASPGFMERWSPFGGRSKSAPPKGEDVYATSQIRNYVIAAYSRNPAANADMVADQAAKDFAATHIIVNGQWLNTSSHEAGITVDDAGVIEEALNAWKLVAIKDSKLLGYMGFENAEDAVITLSPRPTSTTKERGPEHQVFINNIPTGININPMLLKDQYVNGRFVDPARVNEARAAVQEVIGFEQTPSTLTEAKYKQLSDLLEVNKAAGFMTKDRANMYKDRLDKAWTASQTHTKVTEQIRHDKEKLDADPVAAAFTTKLTPLNGDDLADWKSYGKFTPDPVGTFDVAKRMSGKGHVGPSLMAMVGGFHPARYEGPDGDVRVGFGYSLKQDPKVIAQDFTRARIVPDRMQADRIVKAVQEGKYKLNEQEARQLYDAQAARAQKQIQQVFGDSWKKLQPTTQHAITVLYLNTKPGRFNEVFEAVKEGDWRAVGNELAVDGKHRESAVAGIRALLAGQQTYNSLLTNNF